MIGQGFEMADDRTIRMTAADVEAIFYSIAESYSDTYESICEAQGKPGKYESEMGSLLLCGRVPVEYLDEQFTKQKIRAMAAGLRSDPADAANLAEVIELLDYLGAEACEIAQPE